MDHYFPREAVAFLTSDNRQRFSPRNITTRQMRPALPAAFLFCDTFSSGIPIPILQHASRDPPRFLEANQKVNCDPSAIRPHYGTNVNAN